MSAKMNSVIFAILFFVSVINGERSQATEYKLGLSGNNIAGAREAILRFQEFLAKEETDAVVTALPGIGKAQELAGFAKSGILDIALVPINLFPRLSQSPLLTPLLSKDAAGIRRAIDSEVGAFEKHLLEREGFRVLDFWHLSSTILASKSSLASVTELQGKKIAFSNDNNELLQNLGATPVQMPTAEVYTAIQRGVADTAPVPLDNRSAVLGFNEIFNSYVDRQYKPEIYALIVSEDRWETIPYLHQRSLSRAAVDAGENASAMVDSAAVAFKALELNRGASFSTWDAGDIETVFTNSLATSRRLDDRNGQTLTRIAFEAAAALPAEFTNNETRLPKAEVEVYFATDRQGVRGGKLDTLYSNRRQVNSLSFGVSKIELKEGRRFGDNLENAADLLSVRVIGSDQEFNNELASVGAANKPVIVFLHGYNNSFSDALRRAATIKNDIAGDGTVISYTWPSDGSALGYGYDASSASTASQNFQSFMDALTKKVPRKQIHIIAHSMGGRILIDYIVKLQNTQTPTIELKFANLIFAASDITQDLFEQKVAGPRDEPERSLIAFAKTVTVYSSEYDRALGFSHEIHRDKRLGLSTKQDLFLASGLVTIDASSIDPAKFYQKFTTATRHSYVFDKAKGVSDLAGIIANVSPQDRTGLVQDARGQKIFWRMR